MIIIDVKRKVAISVLLFCVFSMVIPAIERTDKKGAALKVIVLLPKLSGVTSEEAEWLPNLVKDKIEANVSKYLCFSLLDTSEMKKKMKLLKMQFDGDNYNESDVVRVGKIMKASYVFFPSVTKTGKHYIISVSCTNTQTAVSDAQVMSKGRDTAEEIFDGQGCAVDEITLLLCEQLKVNLTEEQKIALSSVKVSIKDSKPASQTKETASVQDVLEVSSAQDEDKRAEVMKRIAIQESSTHKVYDKPGDFKYKIVDTMDGVILTGFTDSSLPQGVKTYSIVIPDEIEGLHVVGIENTYLWGTWGRSGIKSVVFTDYIGALQDRCFWGSICSSSLESVVLPEYITELKNTFCTCARLKTVYIPNTVTVLEKTFSSCSSLESVHLPKSLTIIGSGAFSGCGALKEIEIPETVEEIGFSAFSGCKALKKIVLPSSIKYIGGSAFSGCESLEEVIVPDGVKIKFSSDSSFSRCSCLNMKSKLALKKAGCDEF